ncbi:MAG: LysR family transcriptional regulator [Lachnospiraceae bacterium]|jgi:DNA-binding transcriptional LysR family regulator|uniref:LysR family transcriptional regulator n=1 Tax=Clostridium sp. (strain SY8519) TaxID=1042156 RepID=UPI0002171974|nr:LysR family transcriptional regulator [Clostridium sp. SY8519]MCI1654848.1 LysR family transcriptional regulator [Lachnospiraceae bacterium]MCI1657276.1 LysR family transcriptional regulator [Lachnospiraceae bacterium]MCI2195688.1 LysR family transcriptional regulator [Lachnospiraceae bacterium]BAK48015.1 transcriptional regulator [Clostridium sp. SY8519]
MTLLSYQVFQTVVKQGSFQKAAEMLNLTPSAVSHAVASMEKSLGFSLFVRSKNGISLTNYGAQLMPYINAVLNSEESLQQAVSALNGLQHGTVKVGCFSSVCTNWMADIIHRFQREHPAIAIEVYQGTYADVSYWIKNGVVDFGFLSVSSAGDLPIEPLCEDPLLCITSVHYQKEQPSEHMSIEEMKNQVFVSQMETTDADIVNYMKVNGLNVQSSYHVVDDLSTIAMVSEGFGICIMPEMVMKDISYPVRMYPLEPEASRIIGVSALDPDFMAPAARLLYEQVIHTYQNL